MTTRENQLPLWKFQNHEAGFDCTATLVAYWEVSLDPISDDFIPTEISAAELFSRWARRVREEHPEGLIPIHWFVDVNGGDVRTFERMPFQFDHFNGAYSQLLEDFLTFFTWLVDAETGEPLNWMHVPVVDKLWRPKRADKGGFIQEATGWKPSILQPYVYLPSLEKAVHP